MSVPLTRRLVPCYTFLRVYVTVLISLALQIYTLYYQEVDLVPQY